MENLINFTSRYKICELYTQCVLKIWLNTVSLSAACLEVVTEEKWDACAAHVALRTSENSW
jgi:hypothetical protein